ncbi:HNH endonuclease [Duganella vulcania]|uniref:HNH endonuclease n=1 Tax=Duganella vulcania TaxID=2692166 RepID=A0A845GHR0_9BURK|nr:HNH endonuclease [Duganella vulcania]
MSKVQTMIPLAPSHPDKDAPVMMAQVFDGRGNAIGATTLARAIELESKGKGVLTSEPSDGMVLRLNYVPTPDPAEVKQNAETVKARWRRHRVAQLRKRDGDFCFYCHAIMNREEMTLEHLLPKSLKASDSALNMVLSHKLCNEQAQEFSIAEKVRMRERNLVKILRGFNSDMERQVFLRDRSLW